MSRVSAGHYVLGIEGLALLRNWLSDPTQSGRRVRELTDFVSDPSQPPLSIEFDAAEADVQSGYRHWAGNYDIVPNPLIRAEEPVVRGIVDRIRPGPALDAACGTGRHAKYLHARGHRVVGVDATEEMLAKARTAAPEVDFRTGNLLALPIESDTVDLAVCALALTHCESLGSPIAELARVLGPGGRLIISDLHPLLTALGMTAFFIGPDGNAAYVRSYHHPHSAYLAAFNAAGLEVENCFEPTIGEEEVAMSSGGLMYLADEAFRTGLLGLPQALIWELVRRP